MIKRLKQWARALKLESHALSLAARDPRTPFHAKLVVALVAAYALSPIDLIPDFIPVLGYLDDLIIVPLGIAFAVRLIPPEVLAECRQQAAISGGKPRSLAGALVIALLWVVGLSATVYLIFHRR